MAEKGGPPFPPPIPAGVCLECALKDPELREPLRVWREQVRTWGDEQIKKYVQQFRERIVRSLQAIDRFVDSLR